MKSVIAAAILTIGAAATSFAATTPQRDWYILDFNTNSCVSAKAKGLSTPEKFHLGLRADGVIDQVNVDKDDAGEVNFVAISETDPTAGQVTVYWFPNKQNCEIGLAGARAKGLLPDNADLK